MNKYKFNNRIKSYETDATGRVSLANIFYYFQEAANLHATSLEWGIEYLNSIQKFWVLSRLKLRINKYPVHKDDIVIETWSRGANGFFAYRDYQVKLNDEVCIDAVSSWLILDKITHRPCRIDLLDKDIPGLPDNYLEFPEGKIPGIEFKSLLAEKKVNFSDIDINMHVNNGKYVEILMDAISNKLLQGQEIMEIDIQYLHESQMNDILQVFSNSSQETHCLNISIENVSKGKETCRCLIHFRE